MCCFTYLETYGNTKNKIWPHIIAQEAQKPINLNSIFQGCQNLTIRVAISLADIKIQFQDWCQMMGKRTTQITLHSDSCEEFVSNLAYCETPSAPCRSCALGYIIGGKLLLASSRACNCHFLHRPGAKKKVKWCHAKMRNDRSFLDSC